MFAGARNERGRERRHWRDHLTGRGGGCGAILVRLVAALLIVAAAWGAILLFMHTWTPARDQYASQGVYVGAGNGPVDWPQLAATGVDFAYLSATRGNSERDPAFTRNMAGAGDAGIRYGAVHHFDLCRLSNDQATAFVTGVPRRQNALPPVVALDFSGPCSDRPGRAVILSELGTLLSLVEQHSGKPAVLRISKEFEELYRVSGAINRTVWLDGDFFPPDYAAKPWVMWTANSHRRIGGIDGPVDWLVVRPLDQE